MPSQPRPASAPRIARVVALAAVCASSWVLSACGGAGARPDVPSVEGVVATLPELERRVRTGDARGAAALAAAMRARGPVAPRVLALESLARWAIPDVVGARAAADALVQRAVAGDREALLATEQLVTALIAGKRDAEALRATEPLFAGGCGRASICAFGHRLLVAAQLDDDALLRRADAIAPPPDRDSARQRWTLELARSLADAGRDGLHARLIRARLKAQPGDAQAWAALLYRAPRTRGDTVRDEWFAELRGAKLPTPTLRAVIEQPELAADPLLRNALYAVLCERPDATADDWLARVIAAGQSAARGSDPAARAILADLATRAPAHLPETTGRRALIGALLSGGLVDQASQLLAPLLAEVPVHPESLVLHAERLRQTGDVEGAKNAAREATQADPARAAETAGLLVARWAGVWPEQARVWSEVAARAGSAADEASVRLRVLRLLGSYQPPAGAEADLRAYAALLLRDLQRPATQQSARVELGLHVEKLGRLLPRGAWLGASADALVQLCASPAAEARACELAAEGRIRQRDREDALRLWALARDLAPSAAAPLQPEATAAVWAHVGDARGLAAWLRSSGLRAVADLGLSWRIALTLLGGGELTSARPWIQDTLARVGGTDVLLATLTPGRVEGTQAPAKVRVSEAELEVVARSGGADIVLAHLDVLRKAAVARGEAGTEWRYARVQAIALATLGRGEEVHRLLERFAAIADLDVRQRTELADLAARLHLCDVALDVATSLASGSWSESRRVIVAAVRCGHSSQDNVRLAALAERVSKAHIELAVQLEFAQVLARNGAGLLAAAWFQRLLGPGRGAVDVVHHLEWAEVLLRLGRPGEADEVLGQILQRSRGQALVAGARNAARLLVSFERVEAAVALLDRALAVADHPELRHVRLECQLRLGDVAGVAASLEVRARSGLERATLDQLLAIARATKTVPVLHQALQGLQDVDREVERFRLQVASAVQDGAAMDGSVQRLRARGVPPTPLAIEALAAQGRWQRGRAMAEELLAGADGAGSGVLDEKMALLAGIAVRRDPTSVPEAVALGRLALARSNDPTILALVASEPMAREGAADAALALAGHAVETHGDDPAVLFSAGRVALLAGRRDQALDYWRRATARTLAEPHRAESRGSTSGVPDEIALLILGLRDVGETALLRAWLPLWIDQRPHVPELWAQWVDADVTAGEPAVGLARLRQADRVLASWPSESMHGVARTLLRAGMGPAMAALLVSGEALQRNDPWWQAFALGVVEDHGQALPAGAREAFVRSTRATLAATQLGRAWLARHLTERGHVDEAIAALGPSPFAAAHLELRASSDDEEIAAAVSGLLVAMLRRPQARLRVGEVGAAADPLAALRDVPVAGRQQAVLAQARAWLARTSVADVVLVAEYLAVQGQGAIARRLILDALPASAPMVAQGLWMLRALRVIAASGDAAEIEAFAARCIDAPAVDGATYDHAARRREISQRLLAWGQPLAARALLETSRRVPAITSGWVPPGQEGVTFADGALQRFDPRALVVVPNGAPGSVVQEAFRVLVARGDSAAAVQLGRSAADREDEPWHLRALLIDEALRWRADDVARELLQGARKDAPEGAYACARLALGEGSVEACLHGRPAIALDEGELAAIADALGRGDPAAAKVATAIARSGVQDAARTWLRVLAARLGAADPEARRRGAEAAQTLLAALPSGARTVLSASSLDELGALGLTEIAVEECAVALRAEPHDHGSLNNLAYARLIAGVPAAEVIPMAAASLSVLAGNNAHALLDTLGAIAVAVGDLASARAWQLGSVAATPDKVLPSLPHVRLAEIELRLGHHEAARELAAWVLLAGRAGAFTEERARAVIRASLRATTPASGPTAPESGAKAAAPAPPPANGAAAPASHAKPAEGLPAP